MPSPSEEKKRGLQITFSPACKRGTETIRCHREGRSKHKDSWRVSGTGKEREGVKLRTDWIICALWSQFLLSPSWGGQAGNWVILPQLLAVCAHAQGETAARPGREHMGCHNVDKWKFCPVQTVRKEDKVGPYNGVRCTPDSMQYICFKCLSPKNTAFWKQATPFLLK